MGTDYDGYRRDGFDAAHFTSAPTSATRCSRAHETPARSHTSVGTQALPLDKRSPEGACPPRANRSNPFSIRNWDNTTPEWSRRPRPDGLLSGTVSTSTSAKRCHLHGTPVEKIVWIRPERMAEGTTSSLIRHWLDYLRFLCERSTCLSEELSRGACEGGFFFTPICYLSVCQRQNRRPKHQLCFVDTASPPEIKR